MKDDFEKMLLDTLSSDRPQFEKTKLGRFKRLISFKLLQRKRHA